MNVLEINADTVSSLKEIPGEKGDFFRELVELFQKQAEKNIATLEAHKQDQAKLAFVLHQLKSSSGNLGALNFSRYCSELETKAEKRQITEKEIAALIENYRSLVLELKKY